MSAVQGPRILFLDDDHVLRLFRMLLRDEDTQPSFSKWFAPERADATAARQAVKGLRRSDGATVGLATEEPELASDADVIVFRRGVVDAQMLDGHPRLRLIARLGERPEGIDLAAAQQRGVRVECIARDTIHFTAEHVLLLMLACGKRLVAGDTAVRAGALNVDGQSGRPGDLLYNWVGLSGASGLHGRTLGIVGLGEVGSRVAALARAFGMTVLYNKPRRAQPSVEASLGVRFESMTELLRASDYVSLNVPDLPDTQGMAGDDFFAAMKPGACFVNTSRGSLVREDALYRALKSGHLAAAGLDVHAVEPRLAGDPLLALPNVTFSPHVAGGARSGVLQEFIVIADHIRASVGLA